MTIRQPSDDAKDRQGWWDATITIKARVRVHPSLRGRLQAEMNDGKGSGYSLNDLPTNYGDIDIRPAGWIDACCDNAATGQGDLPDDGDRSDPWESPAASDSTDGDGPSTTATTTPSESASAPAADTAPEPEPKDKRPTTGKTVAGTILAGDKPEKQVHVVTPEEAQEGVPSNDGPTGRTHLFHTPDGPVDCLCQLGTDHGDPTT